MAKDNNEHIFPYTYLWSSAKMVVLALFEVYYNLWVLLTDWEAETNVPSNNFFLNILGFLNLIF